MRIRYLFSSRKTGRIIGGNKHRKPFPQIAKEVIRISDIVLEVLDIRYLENMRNLELEKLVKEQGKLLIRILNKADLVDLREIQKNPILKEFEPYIFFSTTANIGKGKLIERMKIEVKRLYQSKKLPDHKQAHVGIIGYPNTGKSSLINFLSGRNVARKSAEAGFTRGMQKIRFTKDILILDTPGVIPVGENSTVSSEDLKKHANIGVRTYDKAKNPDFVVSELMQEHPGKFEKFYGVQAEGDAEILLEELGKKHHFLKKGGQIDTQRAARLVLKDWQEGKIK